MRSLILQWLLVTYVARVACIKPPNASNQRINLVSGDRAASTADAAGVSASKQQAVGRRKPNFVFILVDDQDKVIHGLQRSTALDTYMSIWSRLHDRWYQMQIRLAECTPEQELICICRHTTPHIRTTSLRSTSI